MKRSWVTAAAAALLSQPASPGVGLQSRETNNVRLVYYSPTHAYLTPHLMRSFENAMRFHSGLFRYRSREKVSILFEDFGDSIHGGATSLPMNLLDIGIAPPNFVFETAPENDRMNLLMNHELTHIVTNDQADRGDRRFRRVFGGKVMPVADDPLSMGYSYLTNPRHYSPRWYHEGLAVFMETWMSGGLGRALGGYDEMAFRAMARDKAHIYHAVGLESEGTTIDFQVGANSYLYGTRFVTYLASRHGVDKLLDWARREDGGRRYFSAQFRKVYGVSLDEEWSRWATAEREWQDENLRLIRQYPVTATRPLTRTPLGSISRGYWDARSRRLYAAVLYPGQIAHLAAIDIETGGIQKLRDLRGAALYYVCSLAFDAEARRLYYTTDNKKWRDLHAYDLETGRSRRLIQDGRIGDLAVNARDRSLWGIRRTDGISLLVRLEAPFQDWTETYRCPYGRDLFDIDISPDGSMLTAAQTDLSGRQKLVRFRVADLLAGNAEPETLHDFEFSSPSNFTFSPDGRYLYGSSYYTGVSNIFRYDFDLAAMDVLSNAETGLFRPMALPDGRLLALEYTAKGFVPVEVEAKTLEDVSAIQYLGQSVVEKYPVVKTWKLGSPSEVDLDAITTYSGPYRPVREIALMSAYPIVQGYKDATAYGWRFNASDAIGLARLDGTLTFSPGGGLPASEKAHAAATFSYWRWKVSGYYNNADFYDLFGPTKASRKGYALRVDHSRNLIWDAPRTLDLEWGVAGYGGLDRLPDYQNVSATHSRFLTGKVGLNYTDVDRSLGAVDDEKGVQAKLFWRANYAGSKMLPRVYGTYDRGFLLPLRNSPVWIRNAAGVSFGDRNEAFANFYFGGFGNNWVDRLETSRYREYYAFPGADLNSIGGKRFVRTMVEWNLPPVKFQRLGATYLYCNWMRLSLFTSGLASDGTGTGRRAAWGNAGAQLDFRIVPFSFLNSTFSAGYARARATTGQSSGEWMISLKLL
ncbi:MAG: hypothetical protein KIT09_06430 [Bryobacteraceae bacterium]|nr:hypothetical protein [Bryobacteraceae bacterium]